MRCDALGRAAGHTDCGRVSAGLRGEHLVRHRRAQGHAGEIIDILNKEINAGLADPKIKARLANLGGADRCLSFKGVERTPRRPGGR